MSSKTETNPTADDIRQALELINREASWRIRMSLVKGWTLDCSAKGNQILLPPKNHKHHGHAATYNSVVMEGKVVYVPHWFWDEDFTIKGELEIALLPLWLQGEKLIAKCDNLCENKWGILGERCRKCGGYFVENAKKAD